VLGGLASFVLDVLRGKESRDDDRAPVASDQAARAAGIAHGVEHVADELGLRDLAADAAHLPAHGRAAQVESPAVLRADQQDDAGVGVVSERVAQDGRGLLALRGAVGKPGCLQMALDVVPDRHRDHHERAHERKDELGTAPGEVSDALEHRRREPTRVRSRKELSCARIGRCREPPSRT
jgi:hypothetical protein